VIPPLTVDTCNCFQKLQQQNEFDVEDGFKFSAIEKSQPSLEQESQLLQQQQQQQYQHEQQEVAADDGRVGVEGVGAVVVAIHDHSFGGF
jgi:hypothetical protein